MTQWDYVATSATADELNKLGCEGWEVVGVTEISQRSVYDPDIEPTLDSPGKLIDIETVITCLLKRPAFVSES